MRLLFLLVTVFLFGSLGCKNPETKEVKAEVKKVASPAGQFERLPKEIMLTLFNNVEMLDYIFHDLPFSMSQDEKESIQTNVSYIGQKAQPNIPPGCKPMARQFYQINGEIEYEADIYFSESCYFYVFYVNGKATYANVMSEAGRNFFNTMISKALNARKQG